MSFFEWGKKIFVPCRHNAYRPHVLRRGSLFVLLAVVFVAEAALVANLMLRQSGQSFLASVISSEVIALTNVQRVSNKLSSLKENAQLNAAAKAKASDMAAKGYFAHISPDGTEPWGWIEGAGYDYQYAGENLAVRFVDSKDVVNAWMASPTHRANIIKSNYTEIGVATAQGLYKGQPATFMVQYFGKPAAAVLALRTEGEVLGAESTYSPASFVDSLMRQAGKLLSEPRATTNWILGAVVALLMVALAFAFFHHIQLQARELLAPGVLVAGMALVLLLANTNFLSATVSAANSQGAATSLVLSSGGVEIGVDSASTER